MEVASRLLLMGKGPELTETDAKAVLISGSSLRVAVKESHLCYHARDAHYIIGYFRHGNSTEVASLQPSLVALELFLPGRGTACKHHSGGGFVLARCVGCTNVPPCFAGRVSGSSLRSPSWRKITSSVSLGVSRFWRCFHELRNLGPCRTCT